MEITLSLPTQQFMLESPAQLASKIKLYAAVAMYQTGELSIGAAPVRSLMLIAIGLSIF